MGLIDRKPLRRARWLCVRQTRFLPDEEEKETFRPPARRNLVGSGCRIPLFPSGRECAPRGSELGRPAAPLRLLQSLHRFIITSAFPRAARMREGGAPYPDRKLIDLHSHSLTFAFARGYLACCVGREACKRIEPKFICDATRLLPPCRSHDQPWSFDAIMQNSRCIYRVTGSGSCDFLDEKKNSKMRCIFHPRERRKTVDSSALSSLIHKPVPWNLPFQSSSF